MAQKKERTRTVDIEPKDAERLRLLKEYLERTLDVRLTEMQVMRLGWKMACQSAGLEPRTEVERIEADVPNGHAGRSA